MLGFKGRKADPFIVTVGPKPENTPVYFNTHEGQEFNLVIEGRMLLNINGKELILNPGDSLYFDSSKPHGMLARWKNCKIPGCSNAITIQTTSKKQAKDIC